MLLEGRNAIVYGAGGSIGGAIARAFAREGATVFLAGRTKATLEKVADDIRAAGGRAETAVVDAMEARSVDEHADAVAAAAAAGSIDISISVISDQDVQGTPMVEMSLEDYLSPIVVNTTSKFLTWRAAARHMKRQGSGVILVFGGDGPPMKDYSIGGLQAAFTVVESMRRQLAAELGRDGVRVVTLQTNGVPEVLASGSEARALADRLIVDPSLGGTAATLRDVGNVAVFAASDWARTITGAAINMTCGAVTD